MIGWLRYWYDRIRFQLVGKRFVTVYMLAGDSTRVPITPVTLPGGTTLTIVVVDMRVRRVE